LRLLGRIFSPLDQQSGRFEARTHVNTRFCRKHVKITLFRCQSINSAGFFAKIGKNLQNLRAKSHRNRKITAVFATGVGCRSGMYVIMARQIGYVRSRRVAGRGTPVRYGRNFRVVKVSISSGTEGTGVWPGAGHISCGHPCVSFRFRDTHTSCFGLSLSRTRVACDAHAILIPTLPLLTRRYTLTRGT